MNKIKHIIGDMAKLLQTLWVMASGIIILLLMLMALAGLEQGVDVMRMASEEAWGTRFIFLLIVFYMAFTAWYPARIIADAKTAMINDVEVRSVPYNHLKFLKHIPRFLGAGVFVVMEIIISISICETGGPPDWVNLMVLAGIFIGISLGSYLIFINIIRRLPGKLNQWMKKNPKLIILPVLAIILLISLPTLKYHEKYIWFIQIVVLHFFFLLFVLSRKVEAHPEELSGINGRLYRMSKRFILLKDNEFWYMMAYLTMFGIVAVIYIAICCSITFANLVGSAAIALLGLSAILGLGYLITLISVRTRINFHFILLILGFVFSGLLPDPHQMHLRESSYSSKVKRMDMETFAARWLKYRRAYIMDSTVKEFPLIYIASDGGASRSAYWVAGVVSQMDSIIKTKGLSDSLGIYKHLYCLTGASGGSVGNSLIWLGAHPENKNFNYSGVRDYITSDFLSNTLAYMLGVDYLRNVVPSNFILTFAKDRGYALKQTLILSNPDSWYSKQMGVNMFKHLETFNNEPGKMPAWIINTTRMQDGNPAMISNIDLTNPRYYSSRIDVLKEMPQDKDLQLSQAVILGARFPYMSPAGGIDSNYYVDGGYFDNSGTSVAFDMVSHWERLLRKNSEFMNDDPEFLEAIKKKVKVYVIHLSNSTIGIVQPSPPNPLSNDLFSPVVTIMGSYGKQADKNNDQLRIKVGQEHMKNLNLFREGDRLQLSMSWFLSDFVRDTIDARIRIKAKETIDRDFGHLYK
jgi:hypothetical protein